MNIKLGRNESVAAVVPTACGGPGWRNWVVWVYVIDGATGHFRAVCLQSEEIPRDLMVLFKAGEAMCSALLDAVETERES